MESIECQFTSHVSHCSRLLNWKDFSNNNKKIAIQNFKVPSYRVLSKSAFPGTAESRYSGLLRKTARPDTDIHEDHCPYNLLHYAVPMHN